ncbi:hypothetical protein H2O64_18420 [Kordia sp. YSTF-M3]|uniref:Uncharacterized protein n=1 Tax=Kordia aestuariivivens TaxID=2759037 RepID=A0ABR7QDM5_9FLAO|nr:hypothetical protein [Kordia aestuariivivens]MBC8756654.1 hypothetical protein [Kordia aestuariivivens]
MRFLKISTILFGVFSFLVLSYLSYLILTQDNSRGAPLLVYVLFVLACIATILNLYYHYKSFYFYRRKKQQQLHKTFSKFLWIGPICFSAFLLFLFGLTVYDIIRFSRLGFSYDIKQFITGFVLLLFGIIGFLEASLLKKRIKQFNTERTIKDEIDDIGTLKN